MTFSKKILIGLGSGFVLGLFPGERAYSVAVPHPLRIQIPLGYPASGHDVEAARVLSTWIDLKTKDGTIQALYEHWVLDRDARASKPRWSILRDVLHWES